MQGLIRSAPKPTKRNNESTHIFFFLSFSAKCEEWERESSLQRRSILNNSIGNTDNDKAKKLFFVSMFSIFK